jgi:hypothetical protein
MTSCLSAPSFDLTIDSQHVEDEELPQQAAQGGHVDRGSMHSEEENIKEG